MMEFFDTTGAHVPWDGQEVTVRASAYALIERGTRRICDLLMIRIKQTPFLVLPGGALEPGRESVRGALEREGLEEISCKLIVDERPFWQDERGFYDQYVGKYFHSLCFWYFAKTDMLPTVPADGIETTEIVWVPLGSVLHCMGEIHPINRVAIRALLAHRRANS